MKKTECPSDTVLFAHRTHDGSIYARRGFRGKASRVSIEELEQLSLRSRQIRVVGSHVNARLLCSLWELENRCGISICRPDYASGVEDDADWVFDTVLVEERHARSIGGDRPMTEDDHTIYQIECVPDIRSNVRIVSALAVKHPALQAMSFFSPLCKPSFGKLMASVLDPRWFVSEKAPNSSSKLRMYLGLQPRTNDKFFAGDVTPRTVRFGYCCAWRPDESSGSDSVESYFTRYYMKQYRRNENMAVLRTSQRFVDVLRSVWLQSIYPRYELLVPGYLFADEPETGRAFAAHLRRTSMGRRTCE